MKPILSLFADFAVLALLLGGCSTTHPVTPQATMFATLQASAAGIDSYRANFEAAYRDGRITAAQNATCIHKYNLANEAIIAAAKSLDAGMLATTPEAVNVFVRDLADLVARLVPPKTAQEELTPGDTLVLGRLTAHTTTSITIVEN